MSKLGLGPEVRMYVKTVFNNTTSLTINNAEKIETREKIVTINKKATITELNKEQHRITKINVTVRYIIPLRNVCWMKIEEKI